jgi:glutamate/tyrosine decarboxylase-like PLP-dependent enzyme
MEQTLDPVDWSEITALGHRMVDDMVAYLQTVRERPAWQRVPDDVRQRLAAPVPIAPEGADSAYRDFVRDVLPYPVGVHPRYWAWVQGTTSPAGMLAEMLAGAMNNSLHAGEHSAMYVEQQVLSWLKDALGYPAEATGLLVGGGSMANFVGLAVARNAKAGWDVKRLGLRGTPFMVYASTETHSSVVKALEALGLGSQALHLVQTDADFRIRVDALADAVAADRRAGKVPMCVVGNAGTVNTGAIDDLTAVAALCRSENLWFHVDGAFGAITAISPALRPAGLELADSLAFDLHKWMYMPYDVGCALVRWPELHRDTFGYQAAYLTSQDRGLTSGPVGFSHYGLDLSRGFRALKVWFCLKTHGLDAYRALVEQNVEQMKYLGELIRADARLELLAPVSLNVACFRYVGDIRDETRLNAINNELLLRLQESGVASPSSTVINGRFALRVANTNHRTRREDFDVLVHEVIRLGVSLT